MAENIITQVSQESTPTISTPKYEGESVDLNSQIHLNIRGKSFTITRDELMSLPESILLCLFPNGVFVDVNNQVIANLTEDDIVYVNFEPSCFQYIIDNYQEAQNELMESTMLSPLLHESSHHNKSNQGNMLQNKPAIIVLREDLDYYVIPPVSGLTVEQMRHLKLGVAEELLKNKLLFSGLGYDPMLPPTVDQKLGPAEKHLLDMLCTSGFERNSEWGSRSIEPSKCVILSLLLVRLRTTPPPAESRDSLEPVASKESGQSRSRSRSRSRLSTLANSARAASRSLSKSRKPNENHTKLLLFWRKPARKCWWSNEAIDVNIEAGDIFDTKEKFMTVKVHIRRVWTLELSVIGVQ